MTTTLDKMAQEMRARSRQLQGMSLDEMWQEIAVSALQAMKYPTNDACDIMAEIDVVGATRVRLIGIGAVDAILKEAGR